MLDLAGSRTPRAGLEARLYESHFVCAADPAGGRALWVRYTALKRPGAPARPTVWLTWFDRDLPSPLAMRVTADEPVAASGDRFWCSSALGAIGPGTARGALEGAEWSLSWEPRAGELPYLPAGWLYDRPIPRSNGASLAPSAVFSGTLSVGGAPVSIDGWDGTVGHNWGSEHAEQWSWLHAGGLGEDGAGWLDLALARVRVARWLTPWIATGGLWLDGVLHRPARRSSVRRSVVGDRTSVALALDGGAELSLEIDAPAAATVEWDYAAPVGPGRTVRNCSVADARIVVREPVVASWLGAVNGRFAVEQGTPARLWAA
ncbi:MAG: hypothetical protein ACYDHH_09465 [Solirubrobacteraceae bacterium]